MAKEWRKVWQVARLGMPLLRTACSDRALQHGFVQVVAAALAGLAVQIGAGGGEDPLPEPLAAGAGVLAGEGPGQLDPARAGAEVGLVLVADGLEVLGEVAAGGGGQHRHAVLVALAGAHRDLVAREVDVLHAQAQRFEQPQAGAVQEQAPRGGSARRARRGRRCTSSRVSTTGMPLAAAWPARCRRARAAPARGPRDRGRAARSGPGSGWTRPRCAGRRGRSGSA